MRQTFKQEEAEQILQEAVRREVEQPAFSAASSAVSQERLRAMAEELGISSAALEAVLCDREMQTRQEQEQAIITQLRQEFITGRRAGFMPHFYAFVGINIFLLLVNLFTRSTGGSSWWFVFPLLAWSLGLYFHAVHTLPIRGASFDHAFARWSEQRIKRKEKEAKRQAEEALQRRKITTREAAEAELDE